MKLKEVCEQVFTQSDVFEGAEVEIGEKDFGCLYGSSKAIKNHGDMELEGYWVLPDVAGMVIYKSRGRIYSYGLSQYPLSTYAKASAYEVPVEEAVEFIRSHGGVVPSDGFVREVVGEVVVEVELRKFNKWSNDDKWDEYRWERVYCKVCKKDGEFFGYQSRSGARVWKRMSKNHLGDFAKRYYASVCEGEVEAKKLEMDYSTQTSDYRVEFDVRTRSLPEDVEQWLKRVAVLTAL